LQIFALVEVHALARRAEGDVAGDARLIPAREVAAQGFSVNLFFGVEGSGKREQDTAQLLGQESRAGRIRSVCLVLWFQTSAL
jgi:hypothetical protein